MRISVYRMIFHSIKKNHWFFLESISFLCTESGFESFNCVTTNQWSDVTIVDVVVSTKCIRKRKRIVDKCVHTTVFRCMLNDCVNDAQLKYKIALIECCFYVNSHCLHFSTYFFFYSFSAGKTISTSEKYLIKWRVSCFNYEKKNKNIRNLSFNYFLRYLKFHGHFRTFQVLTSSSYAENLLFA